MNLPDPRYLSDEPDFPKLPQSQVDIFGHTVSLEGESWRVNEVSRSGVIDWRSVPEGSAKRALKLYIWHCIAQYTPNTAVSNFKDAVRLIRMAPPALNLEEWNANWWVALRAASRRANCEPRLGRLRHAYTWMYDANLPETSDEVAYMLNEWVIPGGVRGEAVSSNDPNEGPLSDREREALIRVAYGATDVSVGRAALLLCIELGANPRNLVLIEERDFHVFVDPTFGTKSYQIDVPRIKKRSAQRETKRRRLTEKTGDLLESLLKANEAIFGGAINPRRPILCLNRPRADLLSHPTMNVYAWHMSGATMAAQIIKWTEANTILDTSARNGARLHVTPRRLRYTFATVLAIMGASAQQIAELLDHSDLQHVRVYIEAAGRLSKRLTETIGPKVEPVYSKFLGIVVDGPDAAQPQDPSAHIIAKMSSTMLGGIGTCGSGFPCKLAPPISCYVCRHFQAWRHADHVGVRDALIRLRDASPNCPGTAQMRGQIDRVASVIDTLLVEIRTKAVQ